MNGTLRFGLAASLLAVLPACSHTLDDPQRSGEIGRSALPLLPAAWVASPTNLAPVQAGWLSQLGDPTLTRLVAEAQTANPNLQSLAASIAQARALVRQSRSQLYPFIGLEVGAAGSGTLKGASAPKQFSIGVEASWEADIWGRIDAGITQAEALLGASEADYRYSQHALAAAVAQTYLAIIEAKKQAQVAAQLVDVLQEISRIANVRLQNGYATAQDVALALRDLENAKEQAILAQMARRDAVRALEILLGRYPSAQADIGPTFPQIPAPPPAGIPSQLLERRPDIIAAERRIAASIAGVNGGKAAQLPRISLTGSVGGASSELDNLLNPANILWRLASNIVTPLFDAGRLKSQVEGARAVQAQAIASYTALALNAFGEVETALDGQVTNHRRAAAIASANAASERALGIARLRYNEGEEDLLDVLTIQQAAFQSRSALIAIERAQLDNYIQLSLALGGHWSAD